jgi:hypothetical protein
LTFTYPSPLNLNGNVIPCSSITINSGGTVTLGSNGGITGTIQINNGGSLSLAGFTLSSAVFNIASGATAITFGGGTIALTAKANGTVLSVLGTPTLTGTPNVTIATAGFNTTVATGSLALNVTLSGAGTTTVTGAFNVFNFSGASGTISVGAAGVNTQGNVTLPTTGGSYAGTGTVSFIGSGTQLFNPGAATVALPITFSGTGTLRLSAGLDMSAKTFTHSNTGTFDLNGFSMAANVFSSTSTGTLRFGGANISITGTSSIFSAGALTYADAASITMASGTAKTFTSGGDANMTLIQGGIGDLALNGVAGACTLYELKGSTTSFVTVAAGLNLTVSKLNLSSGTLRSSSAGTAFNLICTSGTIRLFNQTIKDCNASGGATFLAYTSDGNVDGGGNTGWQFTASSGSNTASPAKGQIRLTGYAPSVAGNQAAAPSKGQIRFTGYAPSVSQVVSNTASPAKGQIRFAGYAPSINATQIVSPAKGQIRFAGYVASVSQVAGNVVAPAKGQIRFAGYAPSVSATQVISPAKGHAQFTGYLPAISQLSASQTVAPGVGHITFNGYAPTIDNAATNPVIFNTGQIWHPWGKKRRETRETLKPVVKAPLETAELQAQVAKIKTSRRTVLEDLRTIDRKIAVQIAQDAAQSAITRQQKAQEVHKRKLVRLDAQVASLNRRIAQAMADERERIRLQADEEKDVLQFMLVLMEA